MRQIGTAAFLAILLLGGCEQQPTIRACSVDEEGIAKELVYRAYDRERNEIVKKCTTFGKSGSHYDSVYECNKNSATGRISFSGGHHWQGQFNSEYFALEVRGYTDDLGITAQYDRVDGNDELRRICAGRAIFRSVTQ